MATPQRAIQDRLRANLAAVRDEIARACGRTGRDPAGVRLVAVTKYAAPEVAAELAALGVADLGENRVQQLVRRAEWFEARAAAAGEAHPARPRWHMIGHLQRNKVKTLLRCCRVIHALDSVRLIEEIQAQAARANVQVEGLIELNLAGDPSKTGAPPEQVRTLVQAAAGCANLRLTGLMTMAPYFDDPEQARPCFSRLRETLRELRDTGLVSAGCDQLSMGMSNDFAVAVEEGATIVRIGSRLFEGIERSPEGAPGDGDRLQHRPES